MYVFRLGKKRKCFCLGLIVLLSIVFYILGTLPSVIELAELHTCPACYGTSLCPALVSGEIVLADLNSVSNFAATIGTKNVFFGAYKGQNLVMKKLGHLSELKNVDRILCDAADLPPDCKIAEAVDYLSDIHNLIMHYVSQSVKDNSQDLNSFHLCPSAEKLDLLLKNVINNNKNVSLDVILVNIWTILHLNAEPLILQILPSKDGWPVPKYIGACGRLVMEEFAGKPLSALIKEPWPIRAHIARQLLTAAKDFTDKHPIFRFYLTDVSLDNIAVDASGHVKFVDLENVIVLDKQPPKKSLPTTWNNRHISENYDCEDCFAFSSDDICSHSVSDHNFYAVCQELLIGSTSSQGLLVDIPQDVLQRHPEISLLLQQCTRSPGKDGRQEAAQRLASILETEASVIHSL